MYADSTVPFTVVKGHLFVFAEEEYYNGPFVLPHGTTGMMPQRSLGASQRTSAKAVPNSDYERADG